MEASWSSVMRSWYFSWVRLNDYVCQLECNVCKVGLTAMQVRIDAEIGIGSDTRGARVSANRGGINLGTVYGKASTIATAPRTAA